MIDPGIVRWVKVSANALVAAFAAKITFGLPIQELGHRVLPLSPMADGQEGQANRVSPWVLPLSLAILPPFDNWWKSSTGMPA